MHIHILGICGTFMAGVAAIARAAGYRVTGSDQGVYPPMSDQLAVLDIEVVEGYGVEQLELRPDVVIIGNVMTRGMPVIEAVLNRKMAYVSGPEWLANEVLAGRRIAAVAGTHGKTTTSSVLAWILDYAGMQPGFLIGGVPKNFAQSARLGDGEVFVIEADEYDTAFFDKRAKFLHYHPDTQIISNIEFDHADIYADLPAIQWQFHQLLRTLPGNGHLVVPAGEKNIDDLLAMGCWTPVETFSSDADVAADWRVRTAAVGVLEITGDGVPERRCGWSMTGTHNAENAVAALLAARHLGVDIDRGLEAIAAFKGVKRRLELCGTFGGVEVYDDFAHHPTAIRKTIEGLKAADGPGRLLVVLEPRSYTMRLGVHQHTLAAALAGADAVWIYDPPDVGWNLEAALASLGRASVSADIDDIVSGLVDTAQSQDRIVIMSNGGFHGIHGRVEQALQQKFAGK